ncbi:MAG: hypothetical protein R3F65_32415 [bacterium]
MPTVNLNVAEALIITEHWVDTARQVFLDDPALVPWLARCDALYAAFLADQHDPQATLREVRGELAEIVERYDDIVRGLDAAFDAHQLLLSPDHPDQERLARARSEVLPYGRGLVNRTVADKAAEAHVMRERLSPQTVDTLGRFGVNSIALLSWIDEVFIPQADALLTAHNRRLELEEEAGSRERGFNLETVRQFRRIEAALRATIGVLGSPEVYATLLGIVDRYVAQADRRAAQRRRAGEAEADAPTPIAAADGGEAAAADEGEAAAADEGEAADDADDGAPPLRFPPIPAPGVPIAAPVAAAQGEGDAESE